MKSEFKFEDHLTEGITKYIELFKNRDYIAKQKVGIGLLGFIVNGSAKESTIPPVLRGFLRGSGSVFVGDQLAGESPAGDKKYINRSDSGTNNRDIITACFNTPYATKMHEHEGAWGPISQQSGDVGNKFVERHLKADAPVLMQFYANEIKNIN